MKKKRKQRSNYNEEIFTLIFKKYWFEKEVECTLDVVLIDLTNDRAMQVVWRTNNMPLA